MTDVRKPQRGDHVLVRTHGSDFGSDSEHPATVQAINANHRMTVDVLVHGASGDYHAIGVYHSEIRLPSEALHSGSRLWRWPS